MTSMGRLVLALLIGVTASLCTTACKTTNPTEETADETQTELAVPEPPVSERIRRLISGIESEDYSVREIGRDDKAIRVDITLKSESLSQGDVKRVTLNALYDIQAQLGKEQHLAVWSYSGQPLTISGMAFYSSLTDTYHFKGPEELN
jgi:hypothetical protein